MSKKNQKDTSSRDDDTIIIRLWPKTPVMYPMAFLALICGVVSYIYGVPGELVEKGIDNSVVPVTAPAENSGGVEEGVIPNVEETAPAASPGADSESAEAETVSMGVFDFLDRFKVDRSNSGLINTILAMIFLFTSAFCLFVVCIDFEVRWSLVITVVIMMIVMAILMADKLGYIELPTFLAVFDHFTLYATPLFYFCVFFIWVLLMIVSAIIARFYYVKIESNEVIAVSGVLETQKRMSTFRMHYTKEIQDVFEYYLPFVRSGRLVLTFPNEEQPLIMDNVLGINRVIKELDSKSSSFKVRGAD